jgi:Phospholipase_D-nuclease N-terminal
LIEAFLAAGKPIAIVCHSTSALRHVKTPDGKLLVFRHHDVSGWAKAIWVIAILIFPYLGVFAYLITQSRGMAERTNEQAQKARDELRHIVSFSTADELEKLDRLKKAGTITDGEFARLRAKLVQ